MQYNYIFLNQENNEQYVELNKKGWCYVLRKIPLGIHIGMSPS